jgi:hypothetical protein
MNDKRLFKIGAIIAGVAALMIMALGVMRLVAGGDGTSQIALGVGVLNTSLLLRVVRWEVNE